MAVSCCPLAAPYNGLHDACPMQRAARQISTRSQNPSSKIAISLQPVSQGNEEALCRSMVDGCRCFRLAVLYMLGSSGTDRREQTDFEQNSKLRTHPCGRNTPGAARSACALLPLRPNSCALWTSTCAWSTQPSGRKRLAVIRRQALAAYSSTIDEDLELLRGEAAAPRGSPTRAALLVRTRDTCSHLFFTLFRSPLAISLLKGPRKSGSGLELLRGGAWRPGEAPPEQPC